MKKKEKKYEFRIISLASLNEEELELLRKDGNAFLLSKRVGDFGFGMYTYVSTDKVSAMMFGQSRAFVGGWSGIDTVSNVFEVSE